MRREERRQRVKGEVREKRSRKQGRRRSSCAKKKDSLYSGVFEQNLHRWCFALVFSGWGGYLLHTGRRGAARCASSPSSSSGAAGEPSWTPGGSSPRTPACGRSAGCRDRGLRRERERERGGGSHNLHLHKPLC